MNLAEDSKRVRGKAFKTLLLESIKEHSLLELDPDEDNNAAEKAYIRHLATRAFDSEDKDSATLLKELLSKSYPGMKSTLPTIDFHLPDNATPLQKADAILTAISSGVIPPDVGVMLVQAAKHIIDIEMATEMKARLDAIEESLGIGR